MRFFFTLLMFMSISQGNASDQDPSFDIKDENSSKERSSSRTTKSCISEKSSDTADSDTENSDSKSLRKPDKKTLLLPKSQTDSFLSQNSEQPPSLLIIPLLKIPGSSVDEKEKSPPVRPYSKSPRSRHKSLILQSPRDNIELQQHALTLEDLVKTDIHEGDSTEDSTQISQNTNAPEDNLPTARKKSSFLSFLTPRSLTQTHESTESDSSQNPDFRRMGKQPSLLLKTFRALYPSKKSINNATSTDQESHESAPKFPQSPASSSSMIQSVETSISLEETAPFITFDSIITPEFIETYQTLQKFYAKVSPKRKTSRSLKQNIEVTETQLRHITESILGRLSFSERTLLYHWYPRQKVVYQRKINETEYERVCRTMMGFKFQKDDKLETVVEYHATSHIPENKKRIIFLNDLFANFFEIQYKGACVADICTIPYTKFSDAFLLFLTFPRTEPHKKSSAPKGPVTFGNKNSHIIQKLIFHEDTSKSDTTHSGLQIYTLGMQTDATDFRFYNDHSAVLLLKGLQHRFDWFEYIDWRRMLLSGVEQSIDFIENEYRQEKKTRDISFIGWKNEMNLPYIQEILYHAHPQKAYAGQTSYFAVPGIHEGLIGLLNDNLNTPREKPASSSSELSPEILIEESGAL